MGVVSTFAEFARACDTCAMYAIYRELHPPTGVEHCLGCHFFNLETEQLLVASTSLLRVYEVSYGATLIGIISMFFRCSNRILIKVLWRYESRRENFCLFLGKPKLSLCAEYRFYGNIQSLEKIKLRHSQRDSLILSFYDAKVKEKYTHTLIREE